MTERTRARMVFGGRARRGRPGVALLLALLPAAAGWSAVRPDVLFIVVDDMNDSVSALDAGSPIRTPHLERLARRGVLFTRAYCASPACNPSRVSALTGLRPTTTGVYGNRSDWRRALPERRTLFQRFREAGYLVKGAGKIFHHQLAGAFHDPGSFDEFRPMDPQNMPPRKLNGAPEYGSPNTDWGPWPSREEDTIDFRTADYCIRALRSPPPDRPLLLACGIFKPHSPFFAPPSYHGALDEVRPPERKADDWDDIPPGAVRLLRTKRWFWSGMQKLERRAPGSWLRFVRSYAACCAFADAQIGRVLDALDRSPRRDRTVVVLWSDHGFHLGEKDHIEKFALWEKTTRVPLIVVAPGVTRAGARCDAPVDLSVLHPTLLELCGLPADPKADGVSVASLLRETGAAWTRPALMTYGRGNHAVRSRRWRYIRYADGSEELYDHRSDPREWSNLASRPEHRAVVEEHRRWLPPEEAAPVADLRRRAGAAASGSRPGEHGRP